MFRGSATGWCCTLLCLLAIVRFWSHLQALEQIEAYVGLLRVEQIVAFERFESLLGLLISN